MEYKHKGCLAGNPVWEPWLPLDPVARRHCFNGGWRFSLGDQEKAMEPLFDDAHWTPVDLPHDFSIIQPYGAQWEAESGFLPGGVGWYRKTVRFPKAWADKRMILSFDGAYEDTWVYCNGRLLGENHNGYCCFAFDLTEDVTCDGVTENVIAVKVENPIPSSRWYSGSGLYRDVTLLVLAPLHVARHGVTVTTPDIARGKGTVCTVTRLENQGKSRLVTLRQRVVKAGQTLAEGEQLCRISGGDTASVSCTLAVPRPGLWSPETPNLYTLRTEVVEGEQVLDRLETRFGFRWFSFDERGFHLNGSPVKLQGMCLHADQGALGAAARTEAMARQLAIVKDMGANTARTSHHAPDEDFMMLCDTLGLMVVEDSFDCWNVARNGNVNDFSRYFMETIRENNAILDGRPGMTWAEFTLRSMARRDRNCPSLILWSLANEIQEGGETSDQFPAIAENLLHWLRQEDPTRPATTSDNTKGDNPTLAKVAELVYESGGIVGYNYASGPQLDRQRQRFAVLLSSETSSSVNSRGVYRSQASAADVDGKLHLTAYDTSTVGWGMTAHDSLFTTMTRDFVAGEFVWTGFDYLGEPTPWNGVSPGSVTGLGPIPNSSYFGVVETTGFPKDTYYFYRSQWNRRDHTVHLVTAWDEENRMDLDGFTPVWLYASAPKVVLYLDGRPIGEACRVLHRTAAGHLYHTYNVSAWEGSDCIAQPGQGAEGLYARFLVRFAPGTISAQGFDEAGQPLRAQGVQRVTTPGPLARIRLDAEGERLLYVSASIVDEAGNPDTKASHRLHFCLDGPGRFLGLDNGDPATTEKYQQASVLLSPTRAQIAACGGKALAILEPTGQAGTIVLLVRAEGLHGARLAFSVPSPSRRLLGYSYQKDTTIRPGGRPSLSEEAVGLFTDGKTPARVAWQLTEKDWITPGDYAVPGLLLLEDRRIPVTGRVHVTEPVAALRNVAVVTSPGVCPVLPTLIRGLLARGQVSGAFPVRWDMPGADAFPEPDRVVTVRGTAAVFGDETMEVTAFVRVCRETVKRRQDVAPTAARVLREPWGPDGTCLTYQWDTAQRVDRVELLAGDPSLVWLSYSLNNLDFRPLEARYREENGAWAFVFPKPLNPIALRVQWRGPREPQRIRVFSEVATLEPDRRGALRTILADGEALPDFRPDRYVYTLPHLPERLAACAFGAATILPKVDGAISIVTLSEDGKNTATYTLRESQP